MTRRKRTAALVVGIVLLFPGFASGTVSVGSDLHGAYDGCIAKFRAAGLGGLVDKLDNSKHKFTIERTDKKLGSHTEADSFYDKYNGVGSGATLFWNPTDTTPFSDGTPQDPCATLYHEMNHLSDIDDGNSRDDVPCNSLSPVNAAEVKATRAENQYRKTQPDLKDHLRTAYGTRANGGGDLPPEGTPCDKPPPYKRPGGAGCGCSAGSTGDPHLITFDQVRYDFQAVGEFVAVRSPSDDLQVQVRQAPVPGSRSVSLNRAVAAKIGSDRISVYMTPTGLEVHQNGQPADLAKLTSPATLQADGSVDITWPDSSELVVHPIGVWGLSLLMTLAPARHGQVEGLFGNADGNRDNDVDIHGGATLPTPPPSASMYPNYADSWRIAQQDSLFDYNPGESTATFTDKNFPYAPTTAATIPGRQAAEAICRAAGVTEDQTLQNCILDVAASGQPVFATDAANLQGSLASVQPPTTPSGSSTPPTSTPPGPPPSPIVGATTLTVPPGGGKAQFTFAGTAGQKVFVDVPSSSVPDQCGVIYVQAPDGSTVGSGCIINRTGFIGRTQLPTTGTYAVVIAPQGTNSGVSEVKLYFAADDTATIPIGGESTLTIAGPGSIATRTFQATAGQKVFIDVPTATVPDHCGVVSLLAPDGMSLAAGCVINGSGWVGGTVLPTTGTYSIVLDTYDRTTGTAHIKLIEDFDQQVTTSIGGADVTATVSQPGAVSRVSFQAAAGQKITVDVSGGTVPDQCGVPNLLAPDGTHIGSGCVIGGTGSIIPTTLPTTGTYTVLISLSDRGTGTLHLRVHT